MGLMTSDTLAKLGEAVDAAVDELWMVVVYDSPESSFIDLVEVFCDLFGHSGEADSKLALLVHDHGSAAVAAVRYIAAVEAIADLGEYGITAAFEPA
jgi:ATP-dependent Clp protease adapter protein ClpS